MPGVKVQIVKKDHGFREMMRAVDAMRGVTYAKVGILADDEKGGLHVPGADLTVAEIAVVHEFGTENGHIPARPFVRPTFDKMRDELLRDITKLVWDCLFGKLTVEGMFNVVGLKLANGIKNYITTGTGVPPPDAPATAIAKAMGGSRTGKFFKPKKARHIGDALADVAATKYVEGLGGHGRGGRKAVGAARTLGSALAQIGALAAVRTLVDTGRMVNAITWAVVTGRDARRIV